MIEEKFQAFRRFKVEGCFFNDIMKCIPGMHKITLKINDSFSHIFFKHSWVQEKDFFVQDGLSTLLNFSVFTFFEYQKIVCKEFKQRKN